MVAALIHSVVVPLKLDNTLIVIIRFNFIT